ncbi:TonB-dependent receptor [Sphingomonas sp.]|uniref:TonB-dependent receptor domain-containing protein n=1 Tax=Sphingomonas sp. TaxID=28214 RepID=UPI0017F4317D|nr:TonB-dependent receptor [Sphingomonas sp.]MBA4760170.1 TonB-dependent receptor [Sphingomonas sp.]
MNKHLFLLAVAPIAFSVPAAGKTVAADSTPMSADPGEAGADQKVEREVFTTGVAKGRDPLDSATSTSVLKEGEIEKLGARSLAEVLRNIPGIRTESSTGESNSNYTIRGLPLASGGSKFMQIEEDGLPVLEFGDIFNLASDIFIRYDFNVGQIEAIRGGSASSFASNSPGGVINLISKTGDVEGGAIAVSTGLDYDHKRIDFDYGMKLSDTLRMHIGGFYRSGEGPRDIGFNAFKGGQLKFNVTKDFAGGYVRLHAKWLDDRSPQYVPVPVRITGTNDNPEYASFANFDVRRDSMLSSNINTLVTRDGANNPAAYNTSEGMHALVKSVGLESQFDLAGWTITERFRYSDISGSTLRNQIYSLFSGAALPASAGGAGGTLSYANGPNAGTVIANPATLNGNGIVGNMLLVRVNANSLDNVSNDLRATRVWEVGGGKLTTTAGVYKSLQTIDTTWLYTNTFQEVLGGGRAALLNASNALGTALTQDGYAAFGLNVTGAPGVYRRAYDVDYNVTAPYGSLNFHVGPVAIGGSVRYDIGKVRGRLFGSDLGGGRVGTSPFDFNNDGVISAAEGRTDALPLTRPAPVNYDYDYVSYSTGINWRLAEPLAVFARYSKGARAGADKILFTSSVSTTDGTLVEPGAAYDTVTQLEGGFKYRAPNATLNVTGFLADTTDRNIQGGTGLQILRDYRAYGAEVEASYRTGPFSVTGGLTYTSAEIRSDNLNPAVNGNTPRHQPDFIYQVTPQYQSELATVGFNFVGTTSSYAQDTNGLKMPGFTVVNAFLQFRPVDRVQLMLNANNLFDTLGFYDIAQSAVPANGIGWGRAVNGRTVSASLRFDF